MKIGRKSSGGKYIKRRKKRLHEKPGQKILPIVEEKEKRKSTRSRGGNKKIVFLRGKKMNVQKKGKSSKTEIKNVLETPSNKFLARQNIITKGSIVEAKKGKVKITNRPTQEGIINGILIE